jgi:hypothetical protein
VSAGRIAAKNGECTVASVLRLVRPMPDLSRLDGPLSARFIMQPLIASMLAVRSGLADARAGRPPYLWSLLRTSGDRLGLLREGWKAVAAIFTMAVCLDALYQIVVFHWIYPVDSLIVAFTLACVPYLLIRGPANRIASAWLRGS